MRYYSFFLLVIFASPVFSAGVQVLFDPSDPEIGPFPTDYLTAPATNTKTARRIRMPAPSDCAGQPNACQEAWLLNDFDGFNLQARVRVRFSGAINPDTIREGVYLVAGVNPATDESGAHRIGDVVRLNQIVFDPATNTAYGKPDTAMDQHRRYLIVVTDAVKDEAGDPVEPDSLFTACTADAGDEYCASLSEALQPLTGANIAGASVFTTMSVTSWLEKARDALADTPPVFSRPGAHSYFQTLQLSMLNIRWQTRVSPPAFENFDLSFGVRLITDSVGAIGFGAYTSPNYLNAGRSIDSAPSAGDPPSAVSTEEVHFHALMPRRAKPSTGYPVVIYGHGMSDSRFGGPSVLAPVFASQGMATIAISAAGHGYGPESYVQIADSGNRIDVPAPGRGADINGDDRIDSSEGCGSVASSPLGFRDCLRQTTVDLLQLVRLIRSGLDMDGDGVADFDPDRIYYAGQSLGSFYGTMFLALEPDVKRAALNSGGGSVMEVGRWSPLFRPATALTLGLRTPVLLNREDGFDEDYVLRNQPPKVVTTPGAIEIQNAIETLEWLQAEGDPASYAVHLKRSPLYGVPEKSVLWQFAWGDASVPNPTQSTLVRHADMQNSAWIYRHDLAHARLRNLEADPHTYLTNILNFSWNVITGATQTQMALFLAGGEILDPNGGAQGLFGIDFFEQPVDLPEGLNFLEP